MKTIKIIMLILVVGFFTNANAQTIKIPDNIPALLQNKTWTAKGKEEITEIYTATATKVYYDGEYLGEVPYYFSDTVVELEDFDNSKAGKTKTGKYFVTPGGSCEIIRISEKIFEIRYVKYSDTVTFFVKPPPPTPYDLCKPVLYKVYQEHGAKINYQSKTIIYSPINRIVALLSDAEFKLLNVYYFNETRNTMLTSSMKNKVGNITYRDANYTLITNFSNWFKDELKKEALKYGNTSVSFWECKNNDCIIKPDFLYGGTIKFKIENGVAIVEDPYIILNRLSVSSLSKFVGRYFYNIRANEFKGYILKDHEDNGSLSESHRRDQSKFKDMILSSIVPKFAKKARFKFCENEYYHCTCVKPCKKR